MEDYALAVLSATFGVLCLLLRHHRRRRRTAVAPSLYTLPNGTEVWHLRASETRLLYDDIWRGGYLVGDAAAPFSLVLSDGDVIVDVGANVGLFATWIAEQAERLRIFSFEPIPTTFKVLQLNAALLQRKGSAVVTLERGLSDVAGEVTMHHHRNMSIWSSMNAEVDRARAAMLLRDVDHAASRAMAQISSKRRRWLTNCVPTCVVRCFARAFLSSLDEIESIRCVFETLSTEPTLRDVGKIHLVKIDVEGAELQVLRGISDRDWLRIEQLTIEVENAAIEEDIVAMLEARGYEIYAWQNAELKELLPHCDVRQVIARKRSN